jgi:hypothetical protein
LFLLSTGANLQCDGVKFTHDNVPYSPVTMKKDESMVKAASRTETYIVRAGIYSSAVKHEIGGEDKARLTVLELVDAFAGNGQVNQRLKLSHLF